MRLVLLGGLSTLLAGLVALGGMLITERRAKPIIHADDQPDEPEHPPLLRTTVRTRRLPSVVSPPCTPKPGWTCWRGRLRLPERVRTAWSAARAVAAVASPAQAALAIDSLGDEVRDEGATIDPDSTARTGDHEILPPEGSFVPFFRVRALPWSDQSGQAVHRPDSAPEREAIAADLDPDGTFQLDVAPGTYDLQVNSEDDRLIAGIDGLVAQPGDAREGLDVTLAVSVQVSGRVVDGDDIGTQATVQVHRVHQDEISTMTTSPAGRFVADWLRPGPYVLVAAKAGAPGERIEIQVPLDGIKLQVVRLPTAMLLVAPSNDERRSCLPGTLILTNQNHSGEQRGIPLEHCQALVPDVFPGSTWRVVGSVGSRSLDRVITFGSGKPIAPVCLDEVCRTDEAAVDIRVVDAGGDLVKTADIEVLDDPHGRWQAGTLIMPLTEGFRAGVTVTLRSTAESLQAAAAVWLMTGVNDIVIRLPGRVRFTEDSATQAQ